jgi:hypothetical protein
MLLTETNYNYATSVSVKSNSVNRNVDANNSKHVQNPRQQFNEPVNARSQMHKTTERRGFRGLYGEKRSKIKNRDTHTTGYAEIPSATNDNVDYFWE